MVGRSDRDDGSGGRIHHAFADRLATMTMTDLGTLTGGATSEALGVNDAGLVVGDSQTSDGDGGPTTHAFVYDMATATMTDIGTLAGGTSSVARPSTLTAWWWATAPWSVAPPIRSPTTLTTHT